MQLEQRSEEGLNLVMGFVSDMLRVVGFVKLTTRGIRKPFNLDSIQ